MAQWFDDWQSQEHARNFDFRSSFDTANLARNYESLNDVRVLGEGIDPSREQTLLEVGCATGEFQRYLGVKYPTVQYYGADISQPAIERAKEKFPRARFFLVDPDVRVSSLPGVVGLAAPPAIVYSKDVVQHQTRPFEFVAELVRTPTEMAVFRCRTRDVGQTVLDPEQSCQYHYGGWMPYIIVNLDELVAAIRVEAPRSEIVVWRNHLVLGGLHARYVPKDCYLRETGTAETAVGVRLQSGRVGETIVRDRFDQNPRYTFTYWMKKGLTRAFRRRG